MSVLLFVGCRVGRVRIIVIFLLCWVMMWIGCGVSCCVSSVIGFCLLMSSWWCWFIVM